MNRNWRIRGAEAATVPIDAKVGGRGQEKSVRTRREKKKKRRGKGWKKSDENERRGGGIGK